MAIPKARRPEHATVNEASLVNYLSTSPNPYGNAAAPTYGIFAFDGGSVYQPAHYNLSMGHFNHQMSESRNNNYYNQQPNTLQTRQFYDEPFGLGATYGDSQSPQRNDSLSAMTYDYNSIRMCSLY